MGQTQTTQNEASGKSASDHTTHSTASQRKSNADSGDKTTYKPAATSDTAGNKTSYRKLSQKERTQWKSSDRDTVVDHGIRHDKLVVAAIDFGTHGSGFALCTRDVYQKDPTKVYCHTWNSGTNITYKAPTSVLLSPEKSLKSFGYDAEKEYLELDTDDDRRAHYLFRQFKMKLFKNPELSERTQLKDINDKSLPAVDVFSAVICFFKEELQRRLSNQGNEYGFDYSDVYWVLTVPAIWNLKAKQFMRKAANKAGIKDNQLSLALEPEAASLYCRQVPVNIVTMKDGAKQIGSLPTGSKYLVLDLGGGTIDITAHQVAEDGGLRELHQACGGYWGGTRVNEEFLKFLKRLVGGDVIQRMKDNSPGEWLDLMNEFEYKKCNFTEQRDKVTIRIPVSLLDAYESITDCTLEETIKDGPFVNKISLKNDKLSVTSEFFQSFFQESIDKVMEYIQDLLSDPNLDGVNTLLAVGGYSECPLMINSLKTKFPRQKVVVPANPSLAVLHGAVYYGYEPEVIASRVCSYTYGIAKQRIWKEGDPIRKKSKNTTRKGQHWCDDVFDKHVEIGQVVKVGEFQDPKDYYTIRKDQKIAVLEFYASTRKDPKFIDETECENVGWFEIELTDRQEGDEGKILVRIGVGGTELKIEAKEASTGKVFKTFCNFLP